MKANKNIICIAGVILFFSPALFGITIPYKNFFLDPWPTMPKGEMISPDGKYLASLHPEQDGTSIIVTPILITDAGLKNNPSHAITHKEPRIASLTWTRDSRYILFFEDQKGNENFHLYRFDPRHPEKNILDLSPQQGAQTRLLCLPKDYPNEAIIETNANNSHVFDVYRLNIKSGKCELLEKNPGNVTDWIADKTGVIRARYVQTGTHVEIQARNSDKEFFRTLTTCAFDDNPSIYGFSPDGASLYFSSAKESNTSPLVQINIQTGKKIVLAKDPNYDVNEALISDRTNQLLAVGILREHFVYKILDRTLANDLKILKQVHEGDIHFQNSSEDETKWIVSYDSPTNPATYLYDRKSKKATLLHRSNGALSLEQLAPMKPVTFSSSDGVLLHGYLTIPKNSKGKNIPAIVMVHGGPWHRDKWGVNPKVQDLAQHGFAVLQVNYRGSTGYGKRFLRAGDKEFGGRMIDDVIDGAHWLVSKGIANPQHMGIFGASYGGYVTLCALAFHPNVFACGVDYVGVSDVETCLKTFPPYWQPLRPVLYQRLGDPTTEKKLLLSQSPLHHVDSFRVPIFIAYGANDARVNRAQSEQMIEALQEKGKLLETPLFKDDEGHGFRKLNNALEFDKKMNDFLEKNL